ncbi:thioredoxin family protein [Segetibacter sp. 3557_3]|uniref:thioredoxin family protein n=1 Tax=Segetibacter sp. 3557_3 TaxID=2547429 RepID=UPI00105879FD|nr:thioredoxin family protein [Segetibacter sp. 3557_3]TDH18267.1 thioredoxin family protein [Segetibacter sp. 3557_3]
MKFQEYSDYFKSILDQASTEHQAPYNNADYMDYTKLNWSRMNRWFKTGKLTNEIINIVLKIDRPQNWIIITEPWCGDAAHNIPFIEMIAKENPLITTSYELRDAPPNRIEHYLFQNTKSIPRLIIKDEQGNDLGTWGPRPKDCQKLYAELLKNEVDFEKMKFELQNWYNSNKGEDLQRELSSLLASLISTQIGSNHIEKE